MSVDCVTVKFKLLGGQEMVKQLSSAATVRDAEKVALEVCKELGVEVTAVVRLSLDSTPLDVADQALLELKSSDGDDSVLLLQVCNVAQVWKWVSQDDEDLKGLLEHCNLGAHVAGCQTAFIPPTGGVLEVLDPVFPKTPLEMLEFLRGGDGAAKALANCPPAEGAPCWAYDGGEWREAELLIAPNAAEDIMPVYCIKYLEGEPSDNLERRLFDRWKGPETPTGEIASKIALTEKEFRANGTAGFKWMQDFIKRFQNKELKVQTWEEAEPVKGMQMFSESDLLPRVSGVPPPHAATHPAPVIPAPSFGVRCKPEENAPWWDILELQMIDKEHVAMLSACTVSQAQGYDATPLLDHAERSGVALRRLVCAPPKANDADDAQLDTCLAESTLYTHKRIREACSYYDNPKKNGWSCPLIIGANPKQGRISFSYAMMGIA